MKFFLVLQQDSLLFITKDTKPQRLSFPPQAVQHQEVVDQKLFEETLRKAFTDMPKTDSMLFLADELTFSHSIPLTKETALDDEFTTFLESVPFSPTVIEKKLIQTKNGAFFLATNGNLYKTIVTLAEENGCTIQKVIPLKLFGELPQEISYDILSKLEKEKDLIKAGDFLGQEKRRTKQQSLPIKQILVAALCITVLACVIAWAAYTQGLIPTNKPPQQTAIPSQQPTVQLSPTIASPIATSPAIKKDTLKIQVLNGSGVAGQAGKIKDQLAALGFTDVQTGNAEGPTANTTIVVFSQSVPKSYQEEILAELKKTLSAIETKQIPTTNDYDISITTGEVK